MLKTRHISSKDYMELINPSLSKRLELLKMDKLYHKAKGSYLYYFDQNHNEIKVVDFVCGYGALLLGHGNEKLKEAAMSYLMEDRPGFVQMSIKETATQTAKWLRDEMKEITGINYITTFANSGAEAVEAAIKHALMEFNEKINKWNLKFEQEAAFLIHSSSRNNLDQATFFEEEINKYKQQNINTIKKNSPVILAAKNAFHGKTLRAVITSWNSEYKNSFTQDNSVTKFVGLDPAELSETFRQSEFNLFLPCFDFSGQLQFRLIKFNHIAAAIIEPIQGEGGIHPVSKSFLQALKQACKTNDVPLIFDEIQTGCYRTGHLLASSKNEIYADYYLLGKALGGGLAKISVLLIDKRRFIEQFGLIHSSTFAEDGWSSHVALHALELLKEKSIEIQKKGDRITQHLLRLKKSYSSVVCDVRGQGLMIGLEFKDFTESNSYCFQMLARSGYLNYVYAAYLLNVWGLRLATPLSAKNVLRIQPSFCITEEDIDNLIQGLFSLCEILYCEDFYKLIEFNLPKPCQGLRKKPESFYHGNIPREEPLEGAQRIGFLNHHIDANTVRESEPSLKVLDDQNIEELIEKILPFSTPVIEGSINIIDDHGKPVHITFGGPSMTSLMCINAISNKNTKPLIDLCQKTILLLKNEEKVELIGLGQYTSILTNNGQILQETKVGLTTGNSFAAYLGIEAIKSRMKERGLQMEELKIGIIGAAGNIASVMAEYFSLNSGGTILLGNSNQTGYQKVVRTARNIYQKIARSLANNRINQPKGLAKWLLESEIFNRIRNNEININDPLLYEILEKEFENSLILRVEHSIEVIKECDVVIVATNAAKPFLRPEHFKPNSLICDLSVPHNCYPELIHNNKSIEVIFGGIIRLPNNETVPIKGFPLEPGQVFGCIGETLLLGLEEIKQSFSLGNITLDQVEQIGEIAKKHGFSQVDGRIRMM